MNNIRLSNYDPFFDEDKEFRRYVKEVIKNIHKEYPSLIEQAQEIIDNSHLKGIKIIDATLSGSYERGDPTPDSDIDIRFIYTGYPINQEWWDKDEDTLRSEIAMTLAGNIVGNFGSYDAHAVRDTIKNKKGGIE